METELIIVTIILYLLASFLSNQIQSVTLIFYEICLDSSPLSLKASWLKRPILKRSFSGPTPQIKLDHIFYTEFCWDYYCQLVLLLAPYYDCSPTPTHNPTLLK